MADTAATSPRDEDEPALSLSGQRPELHRRGGALAYAGKPQRHERGYLDRLQHPQPRTEVKDGSEIERKQAVNLRGGRDPYQFAQALEAKGILLAQVTKEEAERSRTAAPYAKAIGKYAAVLREGEFVAVDKRGHVYQLTQRNTGSKARDIQKFLAKAEWKTIGKVEATKERAHALPQHQTKERTGSAATIFEAHQGSKTAREFTQRLDNAGLLVAIVSPADKEIAQRQYVACGFDVGKGVR